MIITRRMLPRRWFVRGTGATLALPLLDAMVPALTAEANTAAAPVRRLGFIYVANGVAMNHKGVNYWKPKTEGRGIELTPILSPLAAFRDQMTVVSGTSHLQALPLGDGQGEHTRASATWLNGVHPKHTQGGDVRAGQTADQIAASALGAETPLPSLELAMDLSFLVGNCENGYSCVYMNTLSWRTATTPAPTENNPRAVFERLFGDGGDGASRMARLRKDRSILDQVAEDMRRLQRKLGPSDRARVDEYFDAVREVERRIQLAERSSAESPATAGVGGPPVGMPDSFGEHLALMFDLVALAFRADITRVFTLMYGRETGSRTYPEIGVTEGHHSISHHGDKPEKLALYSKVNTYHTSLFAKFLETLHGSAEGDGTLLQRSSILYGGGLSDPNLHDHRDLPLLVVGGHSAPGGRHIATPVDTPMTNLLVGMLDGAGVHVDRLGDSTGRLDVSAA